MQEINLPKIITKKIFGFPYKIFSIWSFDWPFKLQQTNHFFLTDDVTLHMNK